MKTVEQYAKLMGVDPDADLSEIKQKYGQWRDKFEKHLGSEDTELSQKANKNLTLLNEAYEALSSHALSLSKTREQEEQSDLLPLTIELDSCRAGFNLCSNEGFRITRSSVEVGGIRVSGHRDGQSFNVNWPTGKLTFYNSKLEIRALIFAGEVEYRNILEIKRLWFLPMTFVIKHKQADMLAGITIYGFGLGSRIKRLNAEHRLGLKLSY